MEGGAKIFGVYRVKNHDFAPFFFIFSNFRGARPPGSAPEMAAAKKEATEPKCS